MEWRNARASLTWMVGLLIAMFTGIIILVHLDGFVPESSQTALSQLAHLDFGGSPLYVSTQAATALVLLLAADTAYNDFPLNAPANQDGESEQTPSQVFNLVIVPIPRLDRVSVRALAHAVSLRQPVLALHVSPTEEESSASTSIGKPGIITCHSSSSSLPTVPSSHRSWRISNPSTRSGPSSPSR